MVTGERKANSWSLGAPLGDGSASVPASLSAFTAAGSAREPAPKKDPTLVSNSTFGPLSGAAKMDRGFVSPSGAVTCSTERVPLSASWTGAARPMFFWKPVAWLYGSTSQYSNHDTFFALLLVFVMVTSSSSSGSSPNGETVRWSTATPAAASRLR